MAQHPDIQYIRYYCDGSAARKVAPVAPLKTLRLPKIKIPKKIVLHIDPIALCGIIMAAIMLVLMTVGAVRLQSARSQMQTMSAYVDTLKQENDSLKDTLSQGYEIEEIERTALALGLVPKEQVRHVSIAVPEMLQEQEEPGTWERFYIFLTGLFA